ncbi:hypothetical protein KSF78_0008851 [Schistosoma japonicum]|nr:hypothetical protein KSF78_0008851 [Schistosoma japonicum]
MNVLFITSLLFILYFLYIPSTDASTLLCFWVKWLCTVLMLVLIMS